MHYHKHSGSFILVTNARGVEARATQILEETSIRGLFHQSQINYQRPDAEKHSRVSTQRSFTSERVMLARVTRRSGSKERICPARQRVFIDETVSRTRSTIKRGRQINERKRDYQLLPARRVFQLRATRIHFLPRFCFPSAFFFFRPLLCRNNRCLHNYALFLSFGETYDAKQNSSFCRPHQKFEKNRANAMAMERSLCGGQIVQGLSECVDITSMVDSAR